MKTARKTAKKPVRKPSPMKDDLSAIALLKKDHALLKRIFSEFEALKEAGGSAEEKEVLVRQACDVLVLHTRIEEDIFYPAVRRAINDDDIMDEAEVEHEGAKALVLQLLAMRPGDDLFDARFTVLAEQVKHHIREEENAMFPQVERAKTLDLDNLGRRMARERDELIAGLGLDTVEGFLLVSEIEQRVGTRAI